jgi:hypothetical protein
MECDRCWELRVRIEQDPELAKKILDALTPCGCTFFANGAKASICAKHGAR